MTKAFEWEPSYGFCGMAETDAVRLAEALEVVRRRICAYNLGFNNADVRCDCKYGVSVEDDARLGSEQTGCPELREIINRLLHRPETFITAWDGNDDSLR